MKRAEFDKLLDMIDYLRHTEDKYADRHCALNKDCADEVKRRRRDQERYKTALGHMQMMIEDVFMERLEE